MKIKYSFFSFRSYLLVNLMIIIELFILITSLNLSVGSLNSRTVLYNPLKEYIENDGFIFFGDSMSYYESLEEDNEEYEEDGEEVEEQSFDMDELMSELSQGARYTTVSNYYDSEIQYTILPDEIFDKLKLQVKAGKIFKSENTSDKPMLIASANNDDIDVGSIVTDGNSNEYEVAAVLTDQSYLLSFNAYNYEMTYEDFYTPLDINYDDNVVYYTSESQIKNIDLLNKIDISEKGFVTYDSSVSKEEIEADKQILNTYGITMDNSAVKKRSDSLINDDFKKMIPPIAAFAVIVIIGIVSTSVIISKNMTHRLAIMYSCGARKTDCILINSGNIIIVTIVAAFISLFAVIVINISSLSLTFGFVFDRLNLLVSLVVILLPVLLSVVISCTLISIDKLHDELMLASL